MSSYDFRPATAADWPLLRDWRMTPHVREWWGAPGEEPPEDDPRVTRLIVSLGGRPFAFIQDYDPHGWPGHHFGQLPPGTRGIDQYIGEADMLGQGHGPGFIGARMAAPFAAGAPVIATDPHPHNARAIAAYRKLGFELAGPARETDWGRILPMEARAPTG
ncbi:GNAT family N-acetyltransferase [Pseudoroseicyclus sp. CXY001]|uniref:GNAT family N-acetyltransferase n=1 Tax=Pseudoroseicyclus sp. CXY001 TaxID=3242492 RepID=UPI00357159F6